MNVRAAIAEIGRKLRGARRVPRPELIAGEHELPEEARAELRSAGVKPDGWLGMLALGVRRLLINGAAVRTVEVARRTTRHELFHWGVRAALGRGLGRTMDLVRSCNPRLRAEADAWQRSFGDDAVRALLAEGWSPRQAIERVRRLGVEEALADRAGLAKPIRAKTMRAAVRQQALRICGRGKRADALERCSQAETALVMERARCAVFRVPPALRRAAECGRDWFALHRSRRGGRRMFG